MQVAIVSDSTGYLPEGAAPQNLTVVPLTVVVDGVSHFEGEGISPAEVAEALRRRAEVSTSRVSPGQFLAQYRRLAGEGAQRIVSIHLSGDLSGTVDAAMLAARESPVPVDVIDSRTVGLAMGFCVLRACARAAAGDTPEAIVAATEHDAQRARTWLVVDSLEQLRRGGRIGAAQAMVGSALMVKPILEVSDGLVRPFEKQRTLRRAVERMTQVAIAAAVGQPCDVAVQHVAAAGRAEELAATLSAALPESSVSVVEVGAVIGAHVGLGTISVALVPR